MCLLSPGADHRHDGPVHHHPGALGLDSGSPGGLQEERVDPKMEDGQKLKQFFFFKLMNVLDV